MEAPKTPELQLTPWNASTIPSFLKSAIVHYCQAFYLDNFRHSVNGQVLDPRDLTAGGGCLLADYVNSLDRGTHVVLFPPQVKVLMETEFFVLADLGVNEEPDYSVVWKSQFMAINKVASSCIANEVLNQVMDELVNRKSFFTRCMFVFQSILSHTTFRFQTNRIT